MIEVISAKETRIRSLNVASTREAREAIVTAKVNSKSGIIDAIDLAIARGLFSVEIKDFDYFPYEIAVFVFIQNSEGKFLIQKRSKIKNGKYDTTGGHPKSGEDSIQGIISEVKEKIGLELKAL